MTVIVALFILGIAFILIEVIIPGGILGGIGALLMMAGCVMAFLLYGAGGGLGVSAAGFALAGILLWVEFKVLPKTSLGKRAFLTQRISGTSSDFGERARALVGRQGEALTQLTPSGYVRIDGQRYDAYCESGHADAGSLLMVVDADNFRLIVSPIQPDTPQHHD